MNKQSDNKQSDNKQSDNKQSEKETKYIEQMTELQKKAYLIAKSHLGTSFNLKKSIGFISHTSV